VCVFSAYMRVVSVSKRISSPLDDDHRRFSCACGKCGGKSSWLLLYYVCAASVPPLYRPAVSVVRGHSCAPDPPVTIIIIIPLNYVLYIILSRRLLLYSRMVVWNSDRNNYTVIIKLLPSSSDRRASTRFWKKLVLLALLPPSGPRARE